MNHRSRWALSFPKKDVVLKRNDSQEPDETAGQKCGTADRQSEERKVEPGHGQVSRSITAVHPSDFQHAPLRLVPSRAANRLGQSSNDCGDNLYSSAVFFRYLRRGGNLARFCVLGHDHNGEVGTMRWIFTIDHDDLTLAVAALVSALAISLALI